MLTQAQIDFFFLNGYLHITNFFTTYEIDLARQETDALISCALNGEQDTTFYFRTAENQSESHLAVIDEILRRHQLPSAYCLLGKPGLLHLIKQLIPGNHFVSSGHSLVIKLPHHGFPHPWHQDPVDVYHFPVFNISVYLDESTPNNGPLQVIPRSHLTGYHQDERFVQHWLRHAESPHTPYHVTTITAKPGDIVVHATTILHGSLWNYSASLRRSIIFHVDHFEDTQLHPHSEEHINNYLDAQQQIEMAIRIRRQYFPNEIPYPYHTINRQTFESRERSLNHGKPPALPGDSQSLTVPGV